MKKVLAVVAWARTRQGKTELGALLGAVGVVYDALHRAGIL